MTHLEQLSYDAFERGFSDFERGLLITDNPHTTNFATYERESWREGWRAAEMMRHWQ